MRSVVALGLLAAVCWLAIFSPWTAGRVNFWAAMTVASGLLAGSALVCDRGHLAALYHFRPRHVIIGVGSAAVLYLFFWAGGQLVTRLFASAGPQISRVYASKAQASPLLIGLLLVGWIGPAEEVFWRGFIQHRMAKQWGAQRGWLCAALLYAAVHIWTLNLMLLIAALVCGLFWGAIFVRCRSVWPGLISHAVWDLTIFVLLPLH